MTTATRQPMTTYAMIETAKRLLSADWVSIQAGNVVRTNRFDDEGRFQAIQFRSNGLHLLGLWSPDGEWQYPEDIKSGESGTFVPSNNVD